MASSGEGDLVLTAGIAVAVSRGSMGVLNPESICVEEMINGEQRRCVYDHRTIALRSIIEPRRA